MSRWMLFVDGENFTIRGQELARKLALPMVVGTFWRPDTYLWLPNHDRSRFHGVYPDRPVNEPTRAHYYTSLMGDPRLIDDTREALWRLEFNPTVFKKDKRTGRTKGVDISLATDMLSGAYKNTYETAVLVAGDADYVPLVEEVKRQGRRVVVTFYGEGNGLNRELRLAADRYTNLEAFVARRWKHYVALIRRGDVLDGEIKVPGIGVPRLRPTDTGKASVDASPASEVT